MKAVRMRRLSPVTLMAAVRAVVEAGTGKACVSDPDGRDAPFFGMELVGSAPKRSKSMRLDEFTVYIHAFAPPSPSQAGLLDLVQEVEEALEATVELPAPFALVGQDEDGIIQIKRDESGEWHAVIAYRITVSYGLIVK